jgi:hypothetical protein
MNRAKYIGTEVHKEAISFAVLDSSGKLVMECAIETKVSMILQFIQGLSESLQGTFEEGTWAAWLYGLLQQRTAKIMIYSPSGETSWPDIA